MNKYKVYKFDHSKFKETITPDNWENLLDKYAEVVYCNGLKEVEKYCGGKLHRYRVGYGGMIDFVEYYAKRV